MATPSNPGAVPAAVALGPPRTSVGLVGWLKANLFSTWYNVLLTLLALWLLYLVVPPMIQWMVLDAATGSRPEVCAEARRLARETGRPAGACWAVIPPNLRLFLVGTYPPQQVHRVWACLGLLAALGLLTAYRPARGKALSLAWLLSFPAVIVLLQGFRGSTLLPLVETTRWGGLLLTFILAIVGIVASFPLGVLLALGRRSALPVVRLLSTLFIELVRGVPLVTILFMSSIMFPLLMPEQVRVDKVVRAMMGFTLFSAAYVAENVRGGLQAIPRGQYEAARALGLGNTLTMGLIILPQALRAVIPPLVGQFISLFKDTSLVVVIGLLDLLHIAQSIIANPDWLGLHREVYLFVAAIYWVFTYTMSRASQRLEVRLGVGTR